MRTTLWLTHLAAGLLGGALVALATEWMRPATEAAPARGAAAAVDPRVEALAARLQALESEDRAAVASRGTMPAAASPGAAAAPGGNGSPAAGSAEPEVDAALLALLREPDDALLDAIGKAVERAQARRNEKAYDLKADAQRESVRFQMRQMLAAFRDPLAISDATAAELEEIAVEIADRRVELWQAGADKDAHAELEREQQQRFRQTLGDDAYGRFQELSIRQGSYNAVAWVGATAGIDAEQRRRLDAVIDAHVARVAPLQVRLQTETLPEAERQRLALEVSGSEQESWRTLLEEILTEEQRRRLPANLRGKW